METSLKLLQSADYLTTMWSGGTTKQLLIFPASAVYANRDFIWRVSSATVELDESDFTPLPDYCRFISTVEGCISLSHDGGKRRVLYAGDIHKFDGGERTHSCGRCTDFNLMLRKGQADGVMSTRNIRPGKASLNLDARAEVALLYCVKGKCDISYGLGKVCATVDDAVLIEGIQDVSVALGCKENTVLMITQMWRL